MDSFAAYLPLLGQRDGTKQTIMARMVPANPFEGIEENVPLITFSMDELWHIAQKQRLRLANTDPLNQLPWTRISLDDTHYPLIYKSSLIFLFRQEKVRTTKFSAFTEANFISSNKDGSNQALPILKHWIHHVMRLYEFITLALLIP